jgi:hypothetical protein
VFFGTYRNIMSDRRSLFFSLKYHQLLVLVLAFVSIAGSLAIAQQADTGIVVGQVLDLDGRAIQKAVVELTHLGTNNTTKVLTDAEGRYRTAPLRLGAYSVRVEARGFKRYEQRGLVLNIGDVREINVELAVGAAAETVLVEASAPLLHTQDSEVGTVITNKQINDMPLNGRDYLQLAALSSGTAPASANAQGGAFGVSIGGQNGVQTAYLLDGADNNSQQMSTSHSERKEVIKPSIDAIEEFKVVTNSYAAEYGRSSSGVISVALKSGTTLCMAPHLSSCVTSPPMPEIGLPPNVRHTSVISSAAQSAVRFSRTSCSSLRMRNSARSARQTRLPVRCPRPLSALAYSLRESRTRLRAPRFRTTRSHPRAGTPLLSGYWDIFRRRRPRRPVRTTSTTARQIRTRTAGMYGSITS